MPSWVHSSRATAVIFGLVQDFADTIAATPAEHSRVWGPKRDDVAKEHPELAPYSDLTDSGKQYDRNSVIGTLNAIMALGHRIGRK